MGHFRVKLEKGAIPHDARLGVRMRRLAPGEEGRGRRTFGPPELCSASWDAWSVQTVPDPIVPGSPFTYYVWPTSSSVLCDGDCLEWAAQWTGCAGAEPSYTITAGDDCVGVVVEVNDTAEALNGCTLTLTATLAGSPFGDPVVISFACVPVCNGYTGGGTFPEFVDSVTPSSIYFGIDAEFCGFEGTFTYDVEVSSVLIQYSISGTPDAITLDLYVDVGNESESLAGQFVSVQPKIDTGSGPLPFCDPITFYCEV